MAAPSTAPKNPLAEGLAKVTGINPLSESAGTASPISYDPDMAFRAPEGDTINITGDPGSGASKAETWSHEIALENLRNQQLQFQYQQQQDILSEALKQQQLQLSQAESGRAAQQLALSQGQYGIQQAGERRAAAQAPYQLESARLANQAAAADVRAKQRAEQDYYNTVNAMAENNAQSQWLNGAALTPQSSAAWVAYRYPQANPNITFAQSQGGGGQMARYPATTYQAPFGSPGYYSQQRGRQGDPYAALAHHK